MADRLWDRLQSRPKMVLVLVFLFTLGFAMVLPGLTFSTDLDNFVPDSAEEEDMDRIRDLFGRGVSVHLIMVESSESGGDVLTPQALTEQSMIAEKVEQVQGVSSLQGIVTLFDAISKVVYNGRAMAQLNALEVENIRDLAIQALKGNLSIDVLEILEPSANWNVPLPTQDELIYLTEVFLSSDFELSDARPYATSTIIIVFLDTGLGWEGKKAVNEQILEAVASLSLFNVISTHTSSVLIEGELNDTAWDVFPLLGVVILILISVVLWISFKRISSMGLAIVSIILAVVWTFGTVLLIGIQPNILYIAVIPLVVGLGIDYAVHLQRRYEEEVVGGSSVPDALKRTIATVGGALGLAAFTTIAAFLSNLTSSITPIQEFGFVCALGIGYAYIIALTFYTSCRYLMDRGRPPKEVIPGSQPRIVGIGTAAIAKSASKYPVLCLITVGIITSMALIGTVELRTSFSTDDFLPETWDSIAIQKEIEENFNGSSQSESYFLIVASEGYDLATVEHIQTVHELEGNLEDDSQVIMIGGKPRTESVLTLFRAAFALDGSLAREHKFVRSSALPEGDCTNEDVKALLDHLYGNQTRYDLLTGNTFDQGLRRVVSRTDDGRYTASLVRVYINAWTSEELNTLFKEMNDDLVSLPGSSVSATGSMLVTQRTLDELQISALTSMVSALLVAFIVLSLIFRSPTLGLVCVLPCFIAAIWTTGAMYLLGISFNVMTVMVMALSIGLGVDYAIHLVKRFYEERSHRNIQSAMETTVIKTGSALFISAFTTVCGFMVLLLSPIPIVQDFGLITSLSISFSSLLALVILPIALAALERRK